MNASHTILHFFLTQMPQFFLNQSWHVVNPVACDFILKYINVATFTVRLTKQLSLSMIALVKGLVGGICKGKNGVVNFRDRIQAEKPNN